MRILKCRFENNEFIQNLNLDNLTMVVTEYDLDKQRVLKRKKLVKGTSLFNDKHDYLTHYVGMPEFQSKKIEPFHKVIFHTNKTSKELSEIFDQPINDETKSIWYPKLVPGKHAKYRVVGGNTFENRYPIYVISKGRSETCKTSIHLSQMNVPHNVVVEPDEVLLYKSNLDLNYANVIELDMSYKDTYDTFSEIGENMGTGSGPARNFCWEHSIDNGYKWHWLMDDNAVEGFFWMYQNTKVKCRSWSFFDAINDFVDRYDNLAIAGLNYSSLCKMMDYTPPYVMNTRIYSFLLIRNDIPYRWRGRYNEDTDLSLRVLKGGWCTVLFNSFLAGKITTQKMKGGNTDTIYKEGTLGKSEMLKQMHPDVTEVTWKFNRWHHQVDYSGFKQKLNPIVNISKLLEVNNYGMKIIHTEEELTSDYKPFLESKYKDLLHNHEQPQLTQYDDVVRLQPTTKFFSFN